jgi:hypothetical protein
MTMVKRPLSVESVSAANHAAISFRAPYVGERLLKDRTVDSLAEAEELFTEAKKYLVLCYANPDVDVDMYSARVDEAWHAFLLYTDQYAEFCRQFFGRYIGHAPTNGPRPDAHDRHGDRPRLTFFEFRERYEALFGEPLPAVWYDAQGITPTRRMFNDSAGRMTVAHRGSVAELLNDRGELIISANAIAYPAFQFMARTGAFYVRELPGGLTDQERIALVAALVSTRALRPAP